MIRHIPLRIGIVRLVLGSTEPCTVRIESRSSGVCRCLPASGNVKLLSNLPRDIHLDGDMPFQAVVGQVACPDGSNSLPSGQPTCPTDM